MGLSSIKALFFKTLFFLSFIFYHIFLFNKDNDSFLISIIFILIFGYAIYISLQINNICLKIFVLFNFLAHAIGAPLLWLKKEIYTSEGLNSVKQFEFHIFNLLQVYFYVILVLYLIIYFTKYFDRFITSTFLGKLSKNEININYVKTSGLKKTKNEIRFNRYDVYLMFFILFIGVPLNIVMATNRIGVLGILPEAWPFHIVGITTTFRYMFIPFILIFLYFKSSRSYFMFLGISFYAILAGLSSSSRSVLLLSFSALIMDLFIRKSIFKSILLIFLCFSSFIFISTSRDYTFTTSDFNYVDAISSTYKLISEVSSFSIPDLIGGIANRFYGAQDMILASQYSSSNPLKSMIMYFYSGGNASAVFQNLTYDFYDTDFGEESGFGVGIGTLAYIIVFGNSSFILLFLACLLLGFFLAISNFLIIWAFKYINPNISQSIKTLFALLLSFTLYNSSLNVAYNLMFVLFMLGTLLYYVNRYIFNFNK